MTDEIQTNPADIAETDADAAVNQPTEAVESASEADASDQHSEPQSFGRWLFELVVMVAVAFALATVVRTYVVQPYVIPTGSMIPTIEIQERVLANKFIYRFEKPKPGDIVVLDDPTGQVPTLIKRVVAVEGQTVDIENGAVIVDGVRLNEPYTHGKPTEPGPVPLPITIPKGYVWVMGDNRPNSSDSRVFGPVPMSFIHGKAILRIWPLSRFATL
ncbi:signal peptidase I [Coriobacteriia bacterium Es71-Z0120]|uniref:signal peptidase I n=1 Tax=Parvivirga hydrogeniphila TaxID=2939460 RepID=UPI002260B7D6|nr:signal peptidase I [Parvivirga hydrogeniphila]MCL4079575.1 signal peptidase I [Parvivirga hydrogeniphila]